MTNTTNIIRKIEALLALASNNSNSNEAFAAAAKAQELIAKYNIQIEQLGQTGTRKICIERFQTGLGHKWKYMLSHTVANNFRCKFFLDGKDTMCFYGYEEDAQTAVKVFEFLFTMGNRLATRYYNECRKKVMYTKGIVNSYLIGFHDGVKSVLGEQCAALMIVTPQKVIDSYNEMAKKFRRSCSTLYRSEDQKSYETGWTAGKKAMSRTLDR